MAEYRDDFTGQEQDDAPDPPEPELSEEVCTVCGNVFIAPHEDDPSNRFCSAACRWKWEKRTLCAAPPTTDDDRDSPIPF
jgi:hypothetical protein